MAAIFKDDATKKDLILGICDINREVLISDDVISRSGDVLKISNSQFDKFSISGGVVDGVSQILELLKYNSDQVL